MLGTIFNIVIGILVVVVVVAMLVRASTTRKIQSIAGDLANDKRYHEALQMVLQDSDQNGYKFNRAVQYLIENGVPAAEAQPNIERFVRQWRIEYEIQRGKT